MALLLLPFIYLNKKRKKKEYRFQNAKNKFVMCIKRNKKTFHKNLLNN